MPTVAIVETMRSDEFARVKETTPVREFLVENDGDAKPALVEYFSRNDKLLCHSHRLWDDCAHTARIRLCGVLTNTVNKEAKVYRRRRNTT